MHDLLYQAFMSYQHYLMLSGVLELHEAKLSLMKWPDVAQSAIRLLDRPDDVSLRETLVNDLSIAIYGPIKVIHQSTFERIKDLSGSAPAKAEKVAKEAEDLKLEDPVKAKTLLMGSIRDMFVVLNTMTDVEYPEV